MQLWNFGSSAARWTYNFPQICYIWPEDHYMDFLTNFRALFGQISGFTDRFRVKYPPQNWDIALRRRHKFFNEKKKNPKNKFALKWTLWIVLHIPVLGMPRFCIYGKLKHFFWGPWFWFTCILNWNGKSTL